MPFIDPTLAGKRAIVDRNPDGSVRNLRPLPPPKDVSFAQYVGSSEVVEVGKLVYTGLLSAKEAQTMFPLTYTLPPVVPKERTNRIKLFDTEKTYVSRWGLTNERFPRWVPLVDSGKIKEHTKDYVLVEKRKTTFQCAEVDGTVVPVSCIDQTCTMVKA